MKAFIPKILLPPAYDDFERRHRARFLHITLFAVFFAGIAFGFTNLSMGAVNLAISLFIMSGLCVVGIILNHNNLYLPGAIILALMVLFEMI